MTHGRWSQVGFALSFGCLIATILSWPFSYAMGFGYDGWRHTPSSPTTGQSRSCHVGILYGRLLVMTSHNAYVLKTPASAGDPDSGAHWEVDGPDDVNACNWLDILSDNGFSVLGLGFVWNGNLILDGSSGHSVTGFTLPHWLLVIMFGIYPWQCFRCRRKEQRGFPVTLKRKP